MYTIDEEYSVTFCFSIMDPLGLFVAATNSRFQAVSIVKELNRLQKTILDLQHEKEAH